MRLRSLAACLALPALACASADLGRVPDCAPRSAELYPLPDSGSCDAAELEAFRSRLAEIVEPDAGPGLVRVGFDAASRVRSACVERSVGIGSWQTRRALAGRVDEIRALPPGPGCLAGRRLDLNRYRAKLAEVRRAERDCELQAATTIESHRNSGTDLDGVARRERESCMAARTDWIVVDRKLRAPLLFARPEDPDASVPPAVETGGRCLRLAADLAGQLDCIRGDGWESLR